MNDAEIKEKIYKLTEQEITSETEAELNKLLKTYPNGTIGIAQINPIAGNLEYNTKKIVKYIKHAQNIGLDLIIFPQMALTGFPLDDTTAKLHILIEENVKWLKQIAKIITKTTALVGFIEPCNNKTPEKYFNSIAVLKDGQISKIIRQSSVYNNHNFNDYKYIGPYTTKTTRTIEINGTKYAILIGDEEYSEQILKENPDIIINCSSTPAIVKEERKKMKILSNTAEKYSTPVIFANQVGAIDGISFSGSSRVFNSNGEVFACAKQFEQQLLICNPKFNLGKNYHQTYDFEKAEENTYFSLDYEADMERTYKILLQGIRDYFDKCGFRRAVLGLSGGLDSTICAVLLADALGCENVFGISMPSKITSQESKSDAEQLANNLGIHFTVAPIKDMFETTNNCLQKIFKTAEDRWDCRYEHSYTSDNIQARSRAMFLWGVSNEFASCLPIATSDKSECYMGYATINGDMSGGFAPIADINKTKLFALAKWLNKNRTVKNAIPESIIQKRPGAELAINPKTGKPLIAEDALMPYEFLDEVIWRIENRKEQYNDMINSEFLYEKNHTISKEQKIEWLDKFYRRMAGALYKKTIMPPIILVDSENSCDKRPITSSKLNFKGHSESETGAIISEL